MHNEKSSRTCSSTVPPQCLLSRNGIRAGGKFKKIERPLTAEKGDKVGGSCTRETTADREPYPTTTRTQTRGADNAHKRRSRVVSIDDVPVSKQTERSGTARCQSDKRSAEKLRRPAVGSPMQETMASRRTLILPRRVLMSEPQVRSWK